MLINVSYFAQAAASIGVDREEIEAEDLRTLVRAIHDRHGGAAVGQICDEHGALVPWVLVDVDGKLWCYASQGLANETWIYDPETESWTEGPDLPHELFVGVTHCKAFERDGRFCVLAKFRGGEYVDAYSGEGSYSYRTFAWDPTREEWDENPFPPPPECASRCSCIDDHLITFTTKPVGGVDFSNPDEVTAYQQGHTTRMYVLAPGDGARWIEWRLPTDARKLSTRITTVRLG